MIAEEARLADPFGPRLAAAPPPAPRVPYRTAGTTWITRPMSPAMFAVLAVTLIVIVLGPVLVVIQLNR